MLEGCLIEMIPRCGEYTLYTDCTPAAAGLQNDCNSEFSRSGTTVKMLGVGPWRRDFAKILTTSNLAILNSKLPASVKRRYKPGWPFGTCALLPGRITDRASMDIPAASDKGW